MTDLTRLREEYDTLSYMDEDGAWGASDALIAALEQRVKELEDELDALRSATNHHEA